ncbi:hypothetical protein Gpo141_00012186, partial [Globisporangium polare]
ESYMTTHSIASASSAFSDAEHRGRTSREDSRASDFSDSGGDGDDHGSGSANGRHAPTSASITDGSRSSHTTPGLFV